MKKIDKIIWVVSVIAILGCLLVLSNGCSRYCAKHYPPAIRDSFIRIETVKLDTQKVYIPGDTTVLLIPIDCPDQIIETENSKQKVKIIFKDRILTGTFICKEDSLKYIIAQQEKALKEVRQISVREPFIPWYYKYLFILLGVVILYLYLSKYGVILWVKNLFKGIIKK